jgi:hypothetical protein
VQSSAGDGAFSIYHNGATVLSIASNGIVSYGTVKMTGYLQFVGSGYIAGPSALGILHLYGDNEATLGMALSDAGLLQLEAYTGTTFATGDKYLVIDASGNVHRSAIGPAS